MNIALMNVLNGKIRLIISRMKVINLKRLEREYLKKVSINKMKKWIKADNGKVTQVVEFDSGSKIELPLDKDGNLKWFDDTKLIKKS